MIEVKNISKKYNNVAALEDLSFNVEKGQVLGLLGPNGAGKSTAMRILTGFIASDSGDVLISNVSINKNPLLAKKSLGYLPENNPVYDFMSVNEYLELMFFLSGGEKSKFKGSIDYVIDNLSLSDVRKQVIKHLSKGFKQRVGLAAALIHSPSLLILDEPTEGLDPVQRIALRKFIKEISKDKVIIISSHVLQEVTDICSHVVILNKGEKVGDFDITNSTANLENVFIQLIKEN